METKKTTIFIIAILLFLTGIIGWIMAWWIDKPSGPFPLFIGLGAGLIWSGIKERPRRKN